MKLSIVPLLFVLLGVAPNSAQEKETPFVRLNLSEIDVNELVKETGRRTTMMTARMADYTYMAETRTCKCDRDGAVKRENVKVFEAYPAYRRQSVRILISENGVARDPEQVENSRKSATRDLMEAERRSAKAGKLQNTDVEQALAQDFHSYGVSAGRGNNKPYKFYIRPTNFLQSHEFFGPGRTLFQGREAVLLNFRPPRGSIASDDSSRVRLRFGGRIWIDAVEKVIMRLEAFPFDEIVRAPVQRQAEPDLSAPLAFELKRLPNGTWVPSVLHLSTCGRERVFEGVKTSTEDRYDSFKLFRTSVQHELQNPLQSPP